jgi:hypothetical protein
MKVYAPASRSMPGLAIQVRGFAPIGMLEEWVLRYCNMGKMAKLIFTKKLKIDNILSKPNIASFHYSTIPWLIQKPMPQEISCIFMQL